MSGKRGFVIVQEEPPLPPEWPDDWQEEIKADLDHQVEAGATATSRRRIAASR